MVWWLVIANPRVYRNENTTKLLLMVIGSTGDFMTMGPKTIDTSSSGVKSARPMKILRQSSERLLITGIDGNLTIQISDRLVFTPLDVVSSVFGPIVIKSPVVLITIINDFVEVLCM